MGSTFYDVLGVDKSATIDEIKRAYFRQVKEHSPEKDPDRFQVIRAAYETLSDERARRDYDTLQAYGGEIDALLEEAEKLVELEDWTNAVRRYKRILVLDPESAAARNSLGWCYMGLKDHRSAVKAFGQLVKQKPDVPAYWMSVGFAHVEAADEHEEQSAEWVAELTEAQEAFSEAVRLQPINSDAHQMVAAVRRKFGDWGGAETWLESAVSADGTTDLHDLDALESLCFVYSASDQLEKLRSTVERIVDIAPDDEDATQYMSLRLATIGSKLAQVGRYPEASIAFEHAAGLNPSDGQIRGAYEETGLLGRADKEFERLKDDPRVVPPLRWLASSRLLVTHGVDVGEQDVKEALFALSTYPSHMVVDSVGRVRSTYPALYEINKEHLDDMTRNPTRYGQGGLTGRSSCFVATAAYGSPVAEQLDSLRAFRDGYLLARPWGRLLVRAYYRVGPRLAVVIERSGIVRRVVVWALNGVVPWLPRG